jgi:hypothetical protein
MNEHTLQTVHEASERALMFVAHRHAMTPEVQAVLEAIHNLTALARRSLPTPTDADLRWALMHDPYCAAAYRLGRQDVARDDGGRDNHCVGRQHLPAVL